jgi:hypothetical protein
MRSLFLGIALLACTQAYRVDAQSPAGAAPKGDGLDKGDLLFDKFSEYFDTFSEYDGVILPCFRIGTSSPDRLRPALLLAG